MSAPSAGRDRLQRALLALSRASRKSAGSASRRPPERRSTPDLAGARAVDAGSSAFEGASRAGRAAPAVEAPEETPLQDGEPGLDLSEVLGRLERIEERISDLQRPPRPLPASRDIFAEWVRLRRWEEIPFADFLKLRRAGSI